MLIEQIWHFVCPEMVNEKWYIQQTLLNENLCMRIDKNFKNLNTYQCYLKVTKFSNILTLVIY